MKPCTAPEIIEGREAYSRFETALTSFSPSPHAEVETQLRRAPPLRELRRRKAAQSRQPLRRPRASPADEPHNARS